MRCAVSSVAKVSSARFVRYGAALCALGGLLVASQILETYSPSLTSYLAGKSPIQDARPLQQQRGVNLDGSLRRASTHPLSLAGNPFENVWRGEAELNDVRLDTGTWSPTLVDVSLPATVPWVIGRSFNSRQDNSGQYDSDGLQGINWFQSSQPELALYVDAGNHANDVLYLVYGADRYVEFNRTGASDDTYKAKNGAAGVFLRTGGSPDVFAYYAPDGMVATFFGFNTSDADHKGQIWKIVNPNGDVAYVGSTSSAASAISGGYDSDGRITTAFDSAGREFDYSYSASTIAGKKRLESVIVTASAVEVARVEYGYYPDSPSPTYGDPGDLRTVKVTLPLTDSGISDVRTTYYRYYEGSYNGSSNRGYPHTIMLVLEPEGARQYDYTGDSTFDDDFIGETTANLKEYSAAYFEYDASRRIDVAFFNGRCGCGSAGSGTFAFSYGTNGSYTNNSGYDTSWCRRTVVDQPDTGWVTQYFDEVGQPLAKIMSDGDPSGSPSFWPMRVTRNSAGCVTHVGTPASAASYSHSTGAIANATTGLVHVYVREPSGDLSGFLDDEMWRDGSAASPPPENTEHYLKSFVWWTSKSTKTIGGLTLVRPLIKQEWDYPNAGSAQYDTDANEVAYDYTTYSGSSQPLALETMTQTMPVVTTAHNGSNVAHVVSTHFKNDGQIDFIADNDGTQRIVEYRHYVNGQLDELHEDANTTSLSPPSGFSHQNTPLDRVTACAYDRQGRLVTTTLPNGRQTRSYYTTLADHRRLSITFPRFISAEAPAEDWGEYFSPAAFQVSSQSCGIEAQGKIDLGAAFQDLEGLAAFIDEAEADPVSAIAGGTVSALSTATFDAAGSQRQTSRVYFAIPGSLPGSDGTHYDETSYGYDEMGRRRRAKEAHGTITRIVYDARAQVTERWIGTNDYSFAGGENSGPDNMVKVEATAFDVNGYTTTKTRYIEDSTTGQRITAYTNDLRGRPVLVANPTAPHILTFFDNEGRAIAVGQYSSTSGLDADSDPTDSVHFATNRLALNETTYDERGRVWGTVRHKIDASDGSDDDTLESLTWYDEVGRVAKQDGEQLEKFEYDRLNRQVRRFVFAYVDAGEDTWAEAIDGATDDLVLEEHETGYDVEGNVLVDVALSRVYAATGSSPRLGAMDSNADGDFLELTSGDVQTQTIAGATKYIARAQITAKWYDDLDRVSDVVQYGTAHATDNIATFDRNGLSCPSRSDDELRTTYEYNYDGTLKQTIDPRGLITRNEYDAEGRKLKVISNYVDGTPGGGSYADEDQTFVYTYTDGLRTTITADLPSPQTDQTTTYFFGTAKGSSGPDSTIATGHLLRKVQYPDSASSTWDIVAFAYNAQGQEMWKRDQATDSGHQSDYNIIETEYDTSGRPTSRSVTQKRSATDGAVLRIETAYDTLARSSTVTQYSNAAGGGGYLIDQVKYEYDGWGDVTDFKQDKDSAVGGSGYWDTSYTYAKATSGRNTIRRTGITLPGGTTYEYQYRASSTAFDDQASRVTSIRDAFATPIATYQYNGVGQVVRTYLDEPSVYSKLYTNAGVAFAGLDRFDRTTVSRWTKDLATDQDFYKVTLGYDADSNVTSQDDAVQAGFDVGYINDNLNRLVDAEEGTWGGSSISSRTRHQIWTLNQTGNWSEDKVDLDGDDNFNETGEWDDTRTHNDVNELSTRDMDSTPGTAGNNYTFAYDAAGNMTDDGESYTYEWDAFKRLRKVRNRSGGALVSEYWYNGLGYPITRHQDTDTDGDVDGSDKYYHSAFDERWRCVATFRDSDSDPKEQFVYQNAGPGGFGGSSYIDGVVLRDRDITNGWTGSADGGLEERLYYAQNWRADVVAVLDDIGAATETIRYSAYGVPFCIPWGDANSDGEIDSSDDTIVNAWITGAYDVRGDTDLDGDVDHADYAAVHANHQRLGSGVLSALTTKNCRGYCAYVYDASIGIAYDVRRRVYDARWGRWLSRDPLGYFGAPSLYAYVGDSPLNGVDPHGLFGDTFVQHVYDRIDAMVSSEINKHLGGHAIGDAKSAGRAAASSVNPPGGDVNNDPFPNFMRHCVASCTLCELLGEGPARGAAEINEVLEDLKDSSAQAAAAAAGQPAPPPIGADDAADAIANNAGMACCRSLADCYVCCLGLWQSGAAVSVAAGSYHSYYNRPTSFNALCTVAFVLYSIPKDGVGQYFYTLLTKNL